MSGPRVSDEITAAMAERLGFPGSTGQAREAMVEEALKFAVEQVNARMKQAMESVIDYMTKLADSMDAAGFTQVADKLDESIRSGRESMASNLMPLLKRASAYEDFAEAFKGVAPGDCQAVNGVYKRFAPFMEAEGSMIRARNDCLVKCPAFKPPI